MKLNILNEDFKLIKKETTLKDAAEFLNRSTVTIYQASARGGKINGNYITRAGDKNSVNQVLLKAIKEEATSRNGEDIYAILRNCLAEIKLVDMDAE